MVVSVSYNITSSPIKSCTSAIAVYALAVSIVSESKQPARACLASWT